MEVIEAYPIRIESVMDALDMKTFGLLAAVGKIELDNFRERSAMGKRGAAKQGRAPSGSLPYGYRIGDDGKPEIDEAKAEIVRRIFRQYVHEGMGAPTINWQLVDEGVPSSRPGKPWHQSHVHRVLANAAYHRRLVVRPDQKGVNGRGVQGVRAAPGHMDSNPVQPLVDGQTWERAQALKKERLVKAKRNTKVSYLLQHLVRCAECGLRFGSESCWTNITSHNGKRYRYEATTPHRYYYCYGMRRHRLHCRKRLYVRADQLEAVVWSEVKRVLQDPGLIVAGVEALDTHAAPDWPMRPPGRSAS